MFHNLSNDNDMILNFLFQVLYLKNLSEKVKQNDLLALFGRYSSDDHQVECKLLKGRMRGQAFVTFCGMSFTQLDSDSDLDSNSVYQ